MPSKYSPEQRAFYRRLARDPEGGADSATARRLLVEDGQAFTIFEHKVKTTAPVKKTTSTTIKPTAAGRAAIARARARNKTGR
jgi:hypothetical protein